jgi:hypothetical protein
MPSEQRRYAVRCFKRCERGKLRHGVWVMTRPSGARGMYVHGDRNEIQAPAYTVETLQQMNGDFVEEITTDEALQLVESWPDAHSSVLAAFERHVIEDS